MPTRPPRPCRQPGCPALTVDGYCEQHRRDARQVVERERPTAHQRGYGRRWQAASKGFLRAHPFCACEDCAKLIHPEAATVVDHVIPHRGDMRLFWDRANWQPMAKRCHDRKTAREDGRWGASHTDSAELAE